MRSAGTIRPDPTMIGNVAEPPFAKLPDPASIFSTRAERFLALANSHQLGPYFRFLAALSVCQHCLQAGLPDPDAPAQEARALAHRHGMPPLDRGRFTVDGALGETLERFFAMAASIDMSDHARMALVRARDADDSIRDEMVRSVLSNAIPFDGLAEHAYVAAALQVHFSRLAARLDQGSLVPVGEGACPACGGRPVASAIVGWEGAHGSRFCSCSLCATRWHVVRIKCVLCSSTKGIAYQELEAGPPTVKAETCDNCHRYVKILHQHKDPALDPVADDIATLGLDLLLRGSGYRRGAVNPFLVGY